MNNTAKLIISIVLTVGLGLLGGIFTAPEIQTWFVHIHKPVWNPPNWLFAPVWTTVLPVNGNMLFTWYGKQSRTDTKRWAIIIFIAQFALNFAWSYIFFNQHQMGWAFVDIVVLWMAILCTIVAFSRINSIQPPGYWFLISAG